MLSHDCLYLHNEQLIGIYLERKPTMKEINLPCIKCGNQQDGIFFNLPEEQQALLNTQKTSYSYHRGHTIFFEGNPSDAVYCVHDGRIKLFKIGTNGDRQVVRLLGPGDIMGFRAIIANEPYTATAETVTNATVCVISREIILKLMDMSPEFSHNMMKKLAIELRQSEEKILSFALHSVKKRCANFLISLIDSDNNSSKSEPLNTLPLMRVEIAQIIGISPETLSRTLKNFSDQKIINLTRKEITILNLPELKDIATK